MGEFSHFDDQGNARMLDVSGKADTERTAVARGSIFLSKEAMEAVLGRKVKKGDVFTVAQVAGIMGAKKCSELIPLCHILPLQSAKISFQVSEEEGRITYKKDCLLSRMTFIRASFLYFKMQYNRENDF